MKKLVVPIDFSEESVIAIENAIQLANKVGLSIRMIHVKKKKNYYLGFSISNDEQLPDDIFENYFKDILKKYESSYKAGGTFDFVLGHGSISHEILKESSHDDVYAIYTGLQGNTSLKDYLIGSNAYRVVAGAKKPVFAIRKGMGVRQIKRILMPIDDSSGSRLKVPIVASLAKYLNAEVVVMALSDSAYVEITGKIEVYARQSLDYLEEKSIRTAYLKAFNVNVPKLIFETIDKESIDLLAFVSELTDDPIGQILSGPVKHILNNSQCPLLCVPISIKGN